MARVATWPKGEPYEHAPTFDSLKEQSGLKAHALRVRLKAVPCFKCPDNSVRYDAAAANDVLEDAADATDELEDPDAPKSNDPVQTALATTTRTLALFSGTVRILNETISRMGEPQKRGMELTNAAVAVLVARLEKYDAMWDRMVQLVEDLQSTQAERAEKATREAERARMRKETFDLAKGVLPDALEKFALTTEAGAAMDVLGSVDPEILEGLLQPGVGLVADDVLPKARKLVELLKKRRAAAEKAAAAKKAKEPKSDATDATAAAANGSSAPETTAAPSSAEEMPNADAR